MLLRAPRSHHLLSRRRQTQVELNLRRLQNVKANAACSLVVDSYSENWTQLWWVRVDGSGRVIDDSDEHALDLLAAKYEQYHATPPPGPVLDIDIEHGGRDCDDTASPGTSWPPSSVIAARCGTDHGANSKLLR